MTNTVLLQFQAQLSGSALGRSQPASGRVVVTPDALVLTVAGGEKRRQRRIPFTAVSDFVVRLPDDAEGDGKRQMSLSVRRFEERQMVTVEAGSRTVDEFRQRLVEVILDGTAVRVTHPYLVNGQRTDATPRDARMRLDRESVAFESGDSTLSVGYADIRYVTKADGSEEEGDGTGRNAYVISDIDGRTVNTAVSLSSTSTCNLLVKHLRAAKEVTEDDDGLTVLVVDDEPGMAELVGVKLESLRDDLSAKWATTALDGLDVLHDRGADVVVSDYQMPEMDGIEFLRTVRKQYPDQPFILFTGKGSETVAAEAIGEGVTDYVTKSITNDSYEQLLRRVERAGGVGE